MCKLCGCGWVLLLVVVPSNIRASIVLEDFEDGDSSGWIINSTGPSGNSWKVGGATGGSPNIMPPPGQSYFARSGEPNAPTESDTGTMRSPAYTVSYSMLEWLSVGWSGDASIGNGQNFFEILDSTFVQRAIIGPAQSDGWEPASINLLTIGLLPGSTFYFRAVDNRNEPNYAWIGFDELKLTGTQVADPGVVPEASSFLVWGLLGLACCVKRLSRA